MNEDQRKLTDDIENIIKNLRREKKLNRIIHEFERLETKARQAKNLSGKPDTSYPG